MTRTSRRGRWPRIASGRPLAAVAIVLSCAVALAGCREPGFDQASAAIGLPPVHGSLPTRADSYLGVYEPSAPASYGQIGDFATKVRQKPNLDLFFSGWGLAFTTAFAQTAYRNGAIPYIDMDPGKISVSGIAAGLQDDYLRQYAASVRRFHHPVVISFGHEANGDWYPWGYHHVPPGVWVSAWRHIVTIFRQSGADNVTWLWIMNHEATGEGPIKDWWPGDAYVNWVGIDGYYILPSENFEDIFGPTIAAIHKMTNKPILISETAVGPVVGRAAKIPNLFAGVRANHLLGLVWFDKSQHQGIQHQNWRIEGHEPAIREFSRQAKAYRLAMPGHGTT